MLCVECPICLSKFDTAGDQPGGGLNCPRCGHVFKHKAHKSHSPNSADQSSNEIDSAPDWLHPKTDSSANLNSQLHSSKPAEPASSLPDWLHPEGNKPAETIVKVAKSAFAVPHKTARSALHKVNHSPTKIHPAAKPHPAVEHHSTVRQPPPTPTPSQARTMKNISASAGDNLSMLTRADEKICNNHAEMLREKSETHHAQSKITLYEDPAVAEEVRALKFLEGSEEPDKTNLKIAQPSKISDQDNLAKLAKSLDQGLGVRCSGCGREILSASERAGRPIKPGVLCNQCALKHAILTGVAVLVIILYLVILSYSH